MSAAAPREFSAEVLGYLKDHHTVTVGTTSDDGVPRVSTFRYVTDGSALLFWARPDSVTARNIDERGKAGFAIDEYTPDLRRTRGVRGIGDCVRVTGEEVARVADLLGQRFPELSPDDTVSISFFSVAPTELEFIDNRASAAETRSGTFGAASHSQARLSNSSELRTEAVRHPASLRLESLTFVPNPRLIRGRLGEVIVGDSRSTLLIWEPRSWGITFAFPRDDVETRWLREETEPDAVRPTALRTYRIEIGDRVVRSAAWEYEAFPDRVALAWNAMDHWYEEEEEIFGHPQDPFHRVDARASRRHVVVSLGGVVLADSSRPQVVFETNLPVRYYMPTDDVRMSLLEPSPLQTRCAYKGLARWWSATVDGQHHESLAWCYDEPLSGAAPIRGMVAFLDERVDVSVDGQRQERPQTSWSKGVRDNTGGGGSGADQGSEGGGRRGRRATS